MKYQRLTAVFTLLCFSPFSHADTYLPQSAGDMLWLMFAAALVFFMQAGFALLEAGATRSKNAVNVIMKNFSDVALGSIAFFTVGFGLMFGNNLFGWFGTSMFFLNDATEWDYGVALFQMMFAATAVTIASGAMAERTRFGAYLVAACVVTAVIYPVFGSWAWGGAYGGSGWLADLGFIDFAGSTVVHSVGAWVALAGILVVGPRTGRFDSQGKPHQITGHNMTFVALGGLILWLGWFGFNAGSTLTADMSVGKISLNTHLSASSGLAGAWLLSRMLGKPTFTATLVNGSLGGLVAITAGCASMEPYSRCLPGLLEAWWLCSARCSCCHSNWMTL